ncbi:hypothetical protein TNCV_5025501 [Trichonephila clavipes]|nr:hypothetical protein TNCV_5025501 [Trichonephila clavipes]
MVVHDEPHPQITVTLSYRPEETGGRQRRNRWAFDTGDWTTDIAFYRGRRLHGGGLFGIDALYVCTFNACPSEKAFSAAGNTGIERQ